MHKESDYCSIFIGSFITDAQSMFILILKSVLDDIVFATTQL
jgi:hypothetical protein